MFEFFVAGGLLATAVVVLSRRTSPLASRAIDDGTDSDAADLPCPWCESQTREDDSHCPSCGQRFG